MIYVGLLLVIVFCLGGGGLLVWSAAKYIRQRIQMRRWPKVQATVVDHATDADDDSIRPYLKIRYAMDGRTVHTACKSPTNTGYALEGGGKMTDTLQRWFARHPIDSTVVVMVNPRDHQEAYTHRPQILLLLALAAFGLLLVAVPVFLLLVALFGEVKTGERRVTVDATVVRWASEH